MRKYKILIKNMALILLILLNLLLVYKVWDAYFYEAGKPVISLDFVKAWFRR